MEEDHLDLRDETIAERVRAGDTDLFGVLVERYAPKLERYGRRFRGNKEDLEDLVQEVFIRAYQNLRSYDSSQRFSPWIYRIAHNAFVDAIRKESRNPLVFVDFDTFFYHPVYDDPEHPASPDKELREMLDQALECLPPKYREALALYYLEEMPYKEIADVLSVPISTVAIRLKRGKELLKEAYLKMHYGT